jgi:hypothetical protein
MVKKTHNSSIKKEFWCFSKCNRFPKNN